MDCHRTDAPAIGRMQLDEALQLRGNILLGGVGDACIGCVVWQRSFQVLQKQAGTLACLGFIAALGPWGFSGLLMGLNMSYAHIVLVRNGKRPHYP